MLKQFHVQYISAGSAKNEAPKSENCLLVITVDRYIHLFINSEKNEPYAKADITLRADQKNLEFRSCKDKLVEMVIKDERRASMLSYFWETKNDKIHKFEFAKKDSREEFLDYASKLKS